MVDAADILPGHHLLYRTRRPLERNILWYDTEIQQSGSESPMMICFFLSEMKWHPKAFPLIDLFHLSDDKTQTEADPPHTHTHFFWDNVSECAKEQRVLVVSL